MNRFSKIFKKESVVKYIPVFEKALFTSSIIGAITGTSLAVKESRKIEDKTTKILIIPVGFYIGLVGGAIPPLGILFIYDYLKGKKLG